MDAYNPTVFLRKVRVVKVDVLVRVIRDSFALWQFYILKLVAVVNEFWRFSKVS